MRCAGTDAKLCTRHKLLYNLLPAYETIELGIPIAY
jgi:hypothetical protein